MLDGPVFRAAGVVLFTIGLVATLWAQMAMGISWRIGVDPSEATPLVTAGPFRLVRNPIFTAMGAPESDARWIATLLVRANLRGHDSHGVIRIPQYWESVKRKEVDPRSPITVTAETSALVRLDGGRGFGQVVGRRAMEMAIAKAKAGGLSAATTSRTSHVGRLADYAEMAARAGLVDPAGAALSRGALTRATRLGAARQLPGAERRESVKKPIIREVSCCAAA